MKKTLLALLLLLLTITVITSCDILKGKDPYPYLHFEASWGEDGIVSVSVSLKDNYEGEIPENLVIPSTDNEGRPITYIYDFSNCTAIKSVTIPDTVTRIGNIAFKNCTSLTDINLSEGYIDIVDGAFENTGYYNDLGNWEYDVLYIGKHLIKAQEIIEGECKIKEGTVSIARMAFYECEALTSVEIPSSITTIPYYSFYGCTSLSTVTISDNSELTTIDNEAFRGCASLSSINLEKATKLTTIGISTFSETGLSDIIIPESVTSIGQYAFNQSGLTNITIPKSVKTIGNSFLGRCYGIKEINVDPDNKYFRAIDGNLYSRDGKTLIQYAPGKTDEIFDIPDSVTTIVDGAFAYNRSLTAIVIPYSVKKVEASAFMVVKLTDVYYTADEVCWRAIEIDDAWNETLIEANIHYNYSHEN